MFVSSLGPPYTQAGQPYIIQLMQICRVAPCLFPIHTIFKKLE